MDILERIKQYRQKICPKTSYQSSNEIVVVGKCGEAAVVEVLRASNEFHVVTLKDAHEFIYGFYKSINNQIIILDDASNNDLLKCSVDLITQKKTSLIIAIYKHDQINQFDIALNSVQKSTAAFKFVIEKLNKIHLLVVHKIEITSHSTKHDDNNNNVDPNLLIGNWSHPTVYSRQQFKYVWTNKDAYDGLNRVLQRLSATRVEYKSSTKLQKLDIYYIYDLIRKLVTTENKDDTYIYSLLRTIFRPESSDNDPSISISIPADKYTEVKPWGEDDGRDNFMVQSLIKNIPTEYLPRIKSVLDYGCAEGAITSRLRETLKISENSCYGADVRTLDASGFTFLSLPQESETVVPPIGSILPQLQDGSIDLITASMVFHHVTHTHAVINELHRVLAPTGILLIREHDCISPSDAVFLDITHGMYSLVTSEPIEWPHFLQEYRAWYRSKEQWNDIMSTCGFQRYPTENYPHLHRSYMASNNHLKNKMNPNDHPCKILDRKNLVKAYYAVYTPIVKINNPSKTLKTQPTTSSHLNNSSSSKRPIDDSHSSAVEHSSKVPRVSSTTTTTTATIINSYHTNNNPSSSSGSNSGSSNHTGTHSSSEQSTSYVVHESSSHRNHYYILYENKPTWIQILPQPPSTTTTSGGNTSASSNNDETLYFMHPTTKERCNISKILYAPITINNNNNSNINNTKM